MGPCGVAHIQLHQNSVAVRELGEIGPGNRCPRVGSGRSIECLLIKILTIEAHDLQSDRQCASVPEVNQIDGTTAEVELRVHRLASLLCAVEAGLCVVVRTEKIPFHARPCGLCHPDHASCIRLPQVRSEEHTSELQSLRHL